MLKHVTINRSNKLEQQSLQLQHKFNQHKEQNDTINNNNSLDNNDLIQGRTCLNLYMLCDASTINNTTSSCQSSPLPDNFRINKLGSAPPSLANSPSKSQTNNLQRLVGGDSMIKVFAQTLSQEVEYVTLHVNSQTKSQQIVKSLLKKFRIKHKDPNLYYLTLERWIRKDGLRFKSVMLLGDEACPLQLQQCCSNPPHNDIKFTLLMRTGSLVRIFCSDVAPNSRYKCLSLSTQTTVEETIELMLHCLNLIPVTCSQTTPTTTTTATISSDITQTHIRQSNSPSSTGSADCGSSSSASSTSSGIESEPIHAKDTTMRNSVDMLTTHSRASSITSVSTASNSSMINTYCDQYCLVIECDDTDFRRILEPDEYLVDVYQSLLAEVREQPMSSPSQQTVDASNKLSDSGKIDEPIKQLQQSASLCNNTSGKQTPEQWFHIKLKRRDDFSISPRNVIKFTNPRQNMPLPPIPVSLTQFNNTSQLSDIVSTTQIEVTNRPYHSRQTSSIVPRSPSTIGFDCVDGVEQTAKPQTTIREKLPPPPQFISLLPPITPRRRNICQASSTFGRPLCIPPGNSIVGMGSRRRYDPEQLAKDLNQLDVVSETASKNKIGDE